MGEIMFFGPLYGNQFFQTLALTPSMQRNVAITHIFIHSVTYSALISLSDNQYCMVSQAFGLKQRDRVDADTRRTVLNNMSQMY